MTNQVRVKAKRLFLDEKGKVKGPDDQPFMMSKHVADQLEARGLLEIVEEEKATTAKSRQTDKPDDSKKPASRAKKS